MERAIGMGQGVHPNDEIAAYHRRALCADLFNLYSFTPSEVFGLAVYRLITENDNRDSRTWPNRQQHSKISNKILVNLEYCGMRVH